MNDKLLTIVVPTYNMEKFLAKCLDSLIVKDNELLRSLEVLVVNDGSKDGSSAIGHRYQDLYPDTFRVIDKENGNYGSCINRGLREASGKFIKILDADDWFDTTNFELFLHFLEKSDADLIISNFDMVAQSGEIKASLSFKATNDCCSIKTEKGLYDLWMHAITYRRAIFDGLNYHQTEGISYTEQEWIFLPMIHVNSVHMFHHVVYKYLVEREGQTISPSVFAKNLSQEIQSWKSQQTAWDLSKKIGQGDAGDYLWYRLSKRAVFIYQQVILKFYRGFKNEQLKDFDKYIRLNNPRLYDELDSFTFNDRRFRFIHYWRKLFYCRPAVFVMQKIDGGLHRITKRFHV